MDLSIFSQLLSSVGSGMARTNSYGGIGAGLDDYRQKQQYGKTLDNLFGTPELNPVQVTPKVSAENPLNSPMRQAAYSAPLESRNGPLGASASLIPLLQSADPSIGMPLLLKMATTQSEYDPTPRYDQTGRAYLVGKNGSVKYLDGVQDRPEVKVENGVAYDPHATKPGTMFNDPNKPFNPDGSPNPAYQQYEITKGQKSAPQTNLTVNTDKTFGSNLGEGAAKILDASSAAAQGGLKTITTVNQIRSALDTGKVAAGPGATFGQVVRQISGGDQDKIVATRQTIQGLAQLTLAARGQMKGQGQISDYEGKLLAKATSGDIDSMTVPEIRAITDVADRAARTAIRTNKGYVDKARKVPGSGSMPDFYNVDEPPPYSPAKTSGNYTIELVQ